MSRLLCLATVVAALGCGALGCGGVVRGAHVRDEDQTLRVTGELRPTGERSVHVRQDGREVNVDVFELCSRVERREIERTHIYRRKSRIKVPVLIVTVGGVVLAGIGGVLYANLPGYPDEEMVRPGAESVVTAREARVLGGFLMGLGGVASISGLVHALRLLGSEREREAMTLDGAVLADRLGCSPPRPVHGARVAGAWREAHIPFGETGGSGTVRFDLLADEAALPPVSETGSPLQVTVDGSPSGHTVDLDSLRPLRDHLRWSQAQAGRCIEPDRPSQCQGLRDYLADFPQGGHAPEAARILRAASGSLALAAERRAAEQAAADARMRAVLAARQAEIERERSERERERLAEERAYEQAEQRAQREREAARERMEQQALEQRAREARQAEQRRCRGTCRETCAGVGACVLECVASNCH